MNTFEYLAVLFSIIVGLALTEMLQSIRALLLDRARVTIFWPSVLRAAMLLIVLVQVWWSVFGLRNTDWSFGRYAIVLVHIGILYLATAVALPDAGARETSDLRQHYWSGARPFYLLLFAAVLVSLAKDLVISGALPGAVNVGFHVLFGAVGLAGAWSRSDRVHLLLTGSLLAAFLLYVVLLFDRLPG